MTNKFRSPLFCPWLLTFCSQNSIQSDPIKTNNRASLFSDQNRPAASSLNQEWKQKPPSWPPRSYAFCPITCSDFIPHCSPSSLTNYRALPGTHLAYFCFRTSGLGTWYPSDWKSPLMATWLTSIPCLGLCSNATHWENILWSQINWIWNLPLSPISIFLLYSLSHHFYI